MTFKPARTIGSMLLVWAVFFGCDKAPAENAAPATVSSPPAAGVIVCMGDSLTAGYGVDEDQAYPALLEARLRDEGLAYRVINAGVSGETSSGALARVDWMLTLDPDIVILETGANDGLRGVEPALTHRNIDAIVAKLQARNITVVLAGMQMVRNLGSDFTRAFGAIYPDIARAADLILIPFFLEGVAGRPDLNQPDGIHPTADGYRIIVDHIHPYIVQAIDRHRQKLTNGG
jgi:acyl-CoA thioesterase-1